MTYGWNHLSEDQKRQFAHECVKRCASYKDFTKTGKVNKEKTILIVGDRPGPGAPQTDNFHHTPFYAKNNSSGWLNAQLILNEITEDKLLWVNSADWKGEPASADNLITHNFEHVIALGGNAYKWGKKHFSFISKFDHPQYHKRFKANEEYPLISFLKSIV